MNPKILYTKSVKSAEDLKEIMKQFEHESLKPMIIGSAKILREYNYKGDVNLNNKTREVLREKFEVISKAADDCTYILADTGLSNEDLKNKLYPKFDRINDEMQVLEGHLKASFAQTENSTQFSQNGEITKNPIISI